MPDLVIDLATECGPLPSGADLAGYGYGGNLSITIEGVLSFTGPMRWGLRVEKPSMTASGRKGKPRAILLLVGNEGESPAELLRHLAIMWDLGRVEKNVEYPLPGADA